jgi:type III secretory pathway component EscV
MAEIIESTKSKLIFADDNKVTPFHIRTSVESYQRQVNLAQKKDMSETLEMRFTNAFKEVMRTAEIEKVEKILRMIESEWGCDRNDYK